VARAAKATIRHVQYLSTFQGIALSMQVHQSARFTTFLELKDFVYRTLCHREQLVVGAFPMKEHVLRRKNTPCGILFVVHGPRSVVFKAVWEIDRNTVLFYGSSGERFQTTRLASAPPILASPLSKAA